MVGAWGVKLQRGQVTHLPCYLRRSIVGYMGNHTPTVTLWGLAGTRYTWRSNDRLCRGSEVVMFARPRAGRRPRHLIGHQSGCLAWWTR